MTEQPISENTVQEGTRRLIQGVVIISFIVFALGLAFGFVSMLTH